jgi:hypothetical protein
VISVTRRRVSVLLLLLAAIGAIVVAATDVSGHPVRAVLWISAAAAWCAVAYLQIRRRSTPG